MTRRASLGLLAGGLLATAVRADTPEQPLDDAAIAALLKDFIEVKKQSLGVAVAVVSPAGRRVVTHGVLDATDPRPVAADTVFDLASVTKSFTGLLLADAVQRGEVSLSDPVAKHLPADVRIPQRGGRQITLVDLATHTSGIPFELPDTNDRAVLARAATDPMGPLYDLLRTTELTADIGSQFAYSNLGYGLLGEALARRAGTSYIDLLRRRVLRPLKMTDTGLDLTPDQRTRRALGHLENLAPAPEWNKPWARAAGGLKSTAQDLSNYVAAHAGLSRTPLAAAMTSMRATRRPAPTMGGDWALGLQVIPDRAGAFFAHGGIGPGFAAVIAFDPAARTGVAVLSNARPQPADLGFHIMRPSRPLIPPPPPAGAPDPTIDRFVGRYVLDAPHVTARLPAGAAFEVIRGPAGIMVQIPGAPRAPLTRITDTRFAVTGFPLSVEFVLDDAGAPIAVILTLANSSARATKQP